MLSAYLVLIFACIAILVIFLYKRLRDVSYIRSIWFPFYVFTAFFMLVHILVPLLQLINGFSRFNINYNNSSHVIILLHSLLFYVFAAASYFILDKVFTVKVSKATGPYIAIKEAHISPNVYNDIAVNKLFWIGMLVFFLGLIASIGNLYHILSLGISVYLSDRIYYAPSSYAVLLANWTYAGCIILYFCRLIAKFQRVRIKYLTVSFYLSIGYTVLYYYVNGNRNSIFLLILALFVVAIYVKSQFSIRSKIRIGKGAVLGVLLMMLFSLTGFLRANQLDSSKIESFYGDFSTSIVKSLNGAFGNNENNMWLIENEFDKLYGHSYAAGFTNLIPRSVWPDKPVGAGPYMRNLVYPGSYIVGAEGNSSYTTGLLNEAILNFGFIGALFIAPLYSLVLFLVFGIFLRSKSQVNKLPLLILAVLLSSQFIYAEFLGFFTRTIFTIAPLLLVYLARRNLILHSWN